MLSNSLFLALSFFFKFIIILKAQPSLKRSAQVVDKSQFRIGRRSVSWEGKVTKHSRSLRLFAPVASMTTAAWARRLLANR